MRSRRRSSAAGRPLPRSARRRWRAFALVASALALSAPAAPAVAYASSAAIVIAEDGTVTSSENVDRNNDGFRDEDPSQPWPLFLIAGLLMIAAIVATVKLFRG